MSAGARLEPYREELPYTYAFGHFAVMEALAHRPADVLALVAHSALPQAWRAPLAAAAGRAGVELRWDDATVTRLRRHEQVTCLAQVAKRPDAVLPGSDHVVLVAPSHAGNVGSAMRSLAAFGFEDVVLVAPRVDPWGPHVVRASVGLRFALRCQVVDAVPDYLAAHPGRRHYAFVPSGGSELRLTALERPLALWFGPEWPAGAARRQELPAATKVSIATRSHVESLNLAVAVSLAAYHAAR